MKNKYIKIILNKNNEFRVDAEISIESLSLYGIKDISLKIDTGCSYTSIPIQKIGISQSEAQKMKLRDSGNTNIIKSISFGVNDTQKDKKDAKHLFETKQYMKLKQIKFIHKDLKINIGGMIIHSKEVGISYDRTGNILIGMDILKYWDIHIGTIDTGETIFLACPHDQINDDYLLELQNIFGIASHIDAAYLRQKLR